LILSNLNYGMCIQAIVILAKNKQSCVRDVVLIGFFYMKLQHGSQHAYQLTCCQILLIHYTVD